MRFSITPIFMIFIPQYLYGGGGGGEGTLGVKKIFRGSFRPAKFLTHMLSLILSRIYFEFGQKKL